jgi:hypothetical protein
VRGKVHKVLKAARGGTLWETKFDRPSSAMRRSTEILSAFNQLDSVMLKAASVWDLKELFGCFYGSSQCSAAMSIDNKLRKILKQ